MNELIIGMGLVAVVLTVSALASGIVERAPLSFPIIFLGIGFALGGTGIIELSLNDPILQIVAIVSLALVFFLDAVNVQIEELREDWQVPMLSLGPGTLLTILGVSIAAYVLVGTSPVESLLLGAVLASTDPVVLRDVLRDERIPRPVRRALSIEAGMNDLVVLPVALVLIAVLTEQISGAGDLLSFLLVTLVLSPLVGLAVGGIGARLMGVFDKRFGIRQEYQALYGIGLVLAAYVAGQAVGGSGFLAAFFGGLAITLFNAALCRCFLEYGQVTSEMMMLVAFVLFGVILSSLLPTVAIFPALALAFIALGIVRPAAMLLVFSRAKISPEARVFIGWFGPRGLSSLLFALLLVLAAAPGAERLLGIVGVVVVVSVIVHGVSATPLSGWYGRRVATSAQTLAEEREITFAGLFEPEAEDMLRITPDALAARLQSDHPPLVLDVRSRAHYERDDGQIPGSIRVLPDQIEEWAGKRAKDHTIIAYCT